MPVCWPPPRLGLLWPLQLRMLMTPAVWTPQSSSGAVTTLIQPMQLTACGAQASLTASHTCLVLTEGLQPADFVHLATNAPHSFTYVASSADAQRTTYMCHETAANKALILLYRQPRISRWQQGANPTH